MSQIADARPRELERFLHDFRERHSAADVIAHIRSLRKLKVLVLGDTIIDEYHFVRPYGMPLKAPVIAAQFQRAESYAGGVLAVANHVAGFCDEVHLVTGLGALDPKRELIESSLRANVSRHFVVQPDAPTTVKRRYLRTFLLQKMFEVSFFDDRPLDPEVDAAACAYLAERAADYDLVIVADFGHGFVTRAMIDVLCAKARFLAVNTQLNSVNYGYHVVTRYPRADYVCIDEEETRIACRERRAPIEGLTESLAQQLGCRVMTVTLGHVGSLTHVAGRESVTVPVLSRQVVDTVGAGDAYLSVTAPCACMGFPAELIGFIGNSVGALAVRIVGNAQPVEPDALFGFIEKILEAPA